MSRDESRTSRPKADGRTDEDPVLPTVSRDETREAWGDEGDRRDEEWYRRERPPHHE